MALRALARDNRPMEIKLNPDKPARRRESGRLAALEAAIDERDETIRLLNEALSRALDELAALDRAA
jgi:hypothetical protein